MKALTTARLSAGLPVPSKVLKTVGVMESWSVGPGVVSMAGPKASELVESTVAEREYLTAGRKDGKQVGWTAALKAGESVAKREKKMGESLAQC